MPNKIEHNYVVEEIKVSDLDIDRRVQREGLKKKKVENMVRRYNPDALGVIHVSRRKTENGALVGNYVIDGWHRMETVRIVTENAGTIVCHVYEGLTVADEAQMFLDLNYGDQPTALDKHKVRVTGGDPQALRIEESVNKYGWKISPVPANGNVNAIVKLYALDELSQAIEAEPDLVSVTFLVITRAWGIDRAGSQAVILEALGRMFAEHSSKIDVPYLIERLKVYPGGPQALHMESARLASITKGKVSMAVASLVTDWYNKSLGSNSKRALPRWSKRS